MHGESLICTRRPRGRHVSLHSDRLIIAYLLLGKSCLSSRASRIALVVIIFSLFFNPSHRPLTLSHVLISFSSYPNAASNII